MAAGSTYLDKAHQGLRGCLPSELACIVSVIEKTAADPWAVLRLSIRMSALCLLASMALSYDLWFQSGRLYAPSPLWPALSDVPEVVNHILYWVMVAGGVIIFFFPRMAKLGFVLLPAFAYFLLQDQLRGQFAVYLYIANLLLAAAMPREPDDAALDPLRYMTIGVYFWAGFYKLNLAFMTVGFPWFVIDWFPYPEAAKIFGYAVPVLEALIGVFLLVPATRWIGQLMAFAMLVVVVLSIGPTGHNEAMTVWPTNVYLDCLAIFLFARNRRSLVGMAQVKKKLNAVALFVFILLPTLGMPEILGKHPSFQLYCCLDYGEIEFDKREKLDFLPDILTERLYDSENRRLTCSDLTMTLFEVGSGTFLATDKPYIDGMRGFCPHLSYPENARLHVIKAEDFRSTDTVTRTYAICETPPKLISKETHD